MTREEPLGLEAAVAMQFLDRQPGEWYCTDCWAEAVDIDPRTVYRVAVLMATEEAVAAGYQAKVGGPLGEGDLDGTVVSCPWHAWRWDVRSGANANNPALRVACFPVVVENGAVFVEL